MKLLNRKTVSTKPLPVKILQFGEGNFLRAFVDWMIQKANERIEFNKGVVVVQPLEKGMVGLLKQQDNLYHVRLEGIKDGKPVAGTSMIDCIQDSVNPYTEYEIYRDYFLSPDLELVFSNTTEAGISRLKEEDIDALPPKSFPGKVCQLLYQRFRKFNGATDKGLTFICCELIDKNATVLREIVLELAQQNQLEERFIHWVQSACYFCNSLVDRIVPGFPRDTIKEIQNDLGYIDNLVVVGEYFHLWAIEAPRQVRERFPFEEAGLNVVWLDNMKLFREKKVRLLNGSHTALVPIGLLSGHETVKEAFDDPLISRFIKRMVDEEVIPFIEGETIALKKFAAEILERFYNPYIRHFLKDISLNSLSKWMTRDYPSLMDGYRKSGCWPDRLTLSLAALLVLYKGAYRDLTFEIKDSPDAVRWIQDQWSLEVPIEEKVKRMLGSREIWGQDLDALEGFTAKVAGYIRAILTEGIEQVVQQLN